MSDNPHVLTEVRGRVGLITLNKPEKLNAWDRPMRSAILAALRRYDADDAIGAVVITGTGDRAFCAGQDFAEAHDFDEERAEAWIREWEELYATLRGLSKPIIAALNGTAAGSAFQVVLLCDLRIAHDEVLQQRPVGVGRAVQQLEQGGGNNISRQRFAREHQAVADAVALVGARLHGEKGPVSRTFPKG